jgi:hypothetical protein
VPFSARRLSADLMREFARALQNEVDRRMEAFISPQKMLRFRHGDRWSITRIDASEDAGAFHELQTLVPMDKNDVVNNSLSKLVEARPLSG